MDSPQPTATTLPEPSRLFLYSLLLPLSWVTVSSILTLILPRRMPGAFALLIVLYLTVTLIGWRFAKRYRRHPTGAERMWLIAFGLLWAVAMELGAMFALVSAPGGPLAGPSKIPAVLGWSIAIDALMIALAFTFALRRSVRFFLGTMRSPTASDAANAPPRGSVE